MYQNYPSCWNPYAHPYTNPHMNPYTNPYMNPYINYIAPAPFPPTAFIQQSDSSFSIESDYTQLCGQKERSSANFTAAGSYTIRIQGPEEVSFSQGSKGISFQIKQDKTAQTDSNLMNVQFKDGYTVYLSGEQYYIANPENATNPFNIVFTPVSGPKRPTYY